VKDELNKANLFSYYCHTLMIFLSHLTCVKVLYWATGILKRMNTG